MRGAVAAVTLATLGAGCGTAVKPAPPPPESATVFADESSGPSLLGRLIGRSEAKAPPEPTPLEEYERSRPKALTVPADTVNALKLMAQDWVLAARERGPRVRATPGGFVREYNTFSDKYTLEIERADDDEEDKATLIGYVFLDSTHLITAEHPTREAAETDANYRQEQRKLRMTFRLLERWEFSELADEYVFNRAWELVRVQYKPVLAARPALPAAPPVDPPQATPRP